MEQQNENYNRAYQRVQEEKGFYSHVTTFLLVNAFLFLLNYFTAKGHWWFYWPLIGWGIGLTIHGIGIFGKNLIFSKKWEENRIKKLMDEEID